MVRYGILLGLLLLPSRLFAQPLPIDHWTPALPTVTERKLADVTSWATVLTLVVLDTKTSWDKPDRRGALMLQAEKTGLTYGLLFAVKQLIHRDRPCAPSCGHDNPYLSFYSGHTALAFQALGGPSVAIVLPLAISTGGLRIAAGKHWLTDVLMGAAAGTLISRWHP